MVSTCGGVKPSKGEGTMPVAIVFGLMPILPVLELRATAPDGHHIALTHGSRTAAASHLGAGSRPGTKTRSLNCASLATVCCACLARRMSLCQYRLPSSSSCSPRLTSVQYQPVIVPIMLLVVARARGVAARAIDGTARANQLLARYALAHPRHASTWRGASVCRVLVLAEHPTLNVNDGNILSPHCPL